MGIIGQVPWNKGLKYNEEQKNADGLISLVNISVM